MNPVDWLLHICNLWAHELRDLIQWPDGTLRGLEAFLGFFPIVLSLIWSFSAVCTLVARRFASATRGKPVRRIPSFCVLIPFHGDFEAAHRTVQSLGDVTPAPDEIVLIDDGSPDGTASPDLSVLPPKTRILRLARNLGKAGALNHALQTIRSEVVICLDADTTAETRDWSRLLAAFAAHPDLGAVTGKIRPVSIRNAVQLLQAIDYLAVINMVKCAESLWGGIMTVSGAWVAYRKNALVECGGWNAKTSAEDIDLSWRFQSSGWKIRYASDWTARVEMAPTWRSLWLQRRRWSSGLGRTMREQWSGIFHQDSRHLPVAFVTLLSALWMWCCVGAFGIAVVNAVIHLGGGHFLKMAENFPGSRWPLYTGVFALQIVVAIFIDRGPWIRYPLLLLIAPFYPVYFWFILLSSYVAGFPRGFLRRDAGKWKPTALNVSEV